VRRAAWLTVLIVLGVGAGVFLFGVGGGDSEPPGASTRSAASTFCPKVSLGPQAGMEFYDHLLRNLGGGLMGESRYYRGQGQTLDIHVGFNVLEVYEDLDFLARGTSVIRGRKFELSKSAGVNAPFWAAASDLGRGPESCRDVTIVGRGGGMNERRFRDLLSALKFPAS
jgi:hypothetical protein